MSRNSSLLLIFSALFFLNVFWHIVVKYFSLRYLSLWLSIRRLDRKRLWIKTTDLMTLSCSLLSILRTLFSLNLFCNIVVKYLSFKNLSLSVFICCFDRKSLWMKTTVSSNSFSSKRIWSVLCLKIMASNSSKVFFRWPETISLFVMPSGTMSPKALRAISTLCSFRVILLAGNRSLDKRSLFWVISSAIRVSLIPHLRSTARLLASKSNSSIAVCL